MLTWTALLRGVALLWQAVLEIDQYPYITQFEHFSYNGQYFLVRGLLFGFWAQFGHMFPNKGPRDID